MDITFEDVAHVIQDARYQQAIFDTTPRPDKRVAALGRSFNLPVFLEKYDICCRTVMSEPLGRWFLEKFADLDEKVREVEEEGNKSENSPVATGERQETKFLEFVGAVHDLRRRDPNNTAPFLEVLQLLREYKLDELELVASFLGGSNKNEALKNAVEEAHALSDDVLDEQQNEEGQSQGDQELEEDDFADDVADTANVTLMEDDGLMETQVSRYNPDKTRGGGVGTVANTTKQRNTGTTLDRSKIALSHGSSMRQHTAKSTDLNTALQQLMERVVSPIYDLFAANKQFFMQYIRFKSFIHMPIGDRQIRYHRVLGQGAFGTVHGCIVAQTGTMLAMKIMSKKKIKMKHSKSQVVAERFALEALAIHPSPYCMRLRYAYQTKESFHFILPLAIGGDLKFHLRQGPFDEKRAKFYAAEIAVGLGHIHSLGFIMRDLKPRNILLDSDGHCKISDFGLAASIADERMVKGRAGTEGYWSPEVINSVPYNIDADWWSYGCCLFELLTGFNPFSCKHTTLQTRNEGTRKATIKYTKNVPASAKILIGALLDRDVKTRLGCCGEGVEEVISPKFAFWKGIDMGKIRRGCHPVPWVPEKGVIYAASQSEMLENDDENGATMRKIKVTAEDVPDFDDFVDLEDHMQDLLKVLPTYNEVSSPPEEILVKKKREATKRGERKSYYDVSSAQAKSIAGTCAAKAKKCVIS